MSVQMQDIPSTGRLFTCDGCGRSERRQSLPEGTAAEVASARFVGWRFPNLDTLTVAYCPACSGADDGYWTETPQESWRVRCNTCDWEWEDTADGLAGWMSHPDRGRDWLPPEAAARFVAEGWAPSLVAAPGIGVVSGTEWIGYHTGQED